MVRTTGLFPPGSSGNLLRGSLAITTTGLAPASDLSFRAHGILVVPFSAPLALRFPLAEFGEAQGGSALHSKRVRGCSHPTRDQYVPEPELRILKVNARRFCKTLPKALIPSCPDCTVEPANQNTPPILSYVRLID